MFQEIRHVLGSAAGGGSDGTPPDDSVTSLDMCVGSDTLVAGHASGRVLLWDYLRCVYVNVFVLEKNAAAVVGIFGIVIRRFAGIPFVYRLLYRLVYTPQVPQGRLQSNLSRRHTLKTYKS